MTFRKLKQNSFYRILCLIALITFQACGIYSFTGASIPPGVTTFQVNFFENIAGNRPGSTVEPGLDNEFTNALQDLIMNQTNLDLVTADGQLIYEAKLPNIALLQCRQQPKLRQHKTDLKCRLPFDSSTQKLRKTIFPKPIPSFTIFLQSFKYTISRMLHTRKSSTE